MNDLENDLSTEIRGLEKAFLRRLAQSDESAAIIATDILEIAVGSQLESRHPVIRAYKAIELWPSVSEARRLSNLALPFPKTTLIIWETIIRGWLASKNFEDEAELARFIASTKIDRINGKSFESLFAELRNRFDTKPRFEARRTVLEFLKIVDFQKENEEFVEAIAKMLGRYIVPIDAVFAAHVLTSLKIEKTEWGIANEIVAFKVAAPFVAKVTERALQIAYDAAHVFDELQLPENPTLQLNIDSLEFADIVWERTDTSETIGFSRKEDDERTNFLDDQGEIIRKWYKKNPTVSVVPFRLVMNTRKLTGPTKGGVSMIIRIV